MAIIDFSEIPEAYKGSGEQDSFELFARDFLEFFGYGIVQGPDRGQDGGRDVIVEDIRKGISGESKVKWLVSCKHKAHSGRAVGVTDEGDIQDRVTAHKCAGFLGFYSTLPSSALINRLEGLKDSIDYQIFDSAKIEKNLLQASQGLQLIRRYFPESFIKWQKDNPKPEKFFWEYPELLCDYCGQNLLEPQRSGIFVEWEKFQYGENERTREVVDLYYCCKGHCDEVLRPRYLLKHNDAIDGWDDIPDICIPTIYFKYLNSLLYELHGDTTFSDKAYNKMINLMSAVFPYISREITEEEKIAIEDLTAIPRFLGGLG